MTLECDQFLRALYSHGTSILHHKRGRLKYENTRFPLSGDGKANSKIRNLEQGE